MTISARVPTLSAYATLPVLLLALLLADALLTWWGGLSALLARVDARYVRPAILLYPLRLEFLAALVAGLGLAAWTFRRVGGPGPSRGSAVAWAAVIAFAAAQGLFLLRLKSMGTTFVPSVAAALAFKLLAGGAIGVALARSHAQQVAWVPTVPGALPAQRPSRWPNLAALVAVALALHLVFPLWDILLTLGGYSLWSLRDGLVYHALRAAVALGVAFAFLRWATAAGVVRRDGFAWAASASTVLVFAFVVLAPVGFVLSAIPYGGGKLPVELRYVVLAAQAFSLLAMYQLLNPARDARGVASTPKIAEPGAAGRGGAGLGG